LAAIKEKGLRISGPIREVYPNDPREVTPDEIIKEIFVPANRISFLFHLFPQDGHHLGPPSQFK
jgi:hypothetical protein